MRSTYGCPLPLRRKDCLGRGYLLLLVCSLYRQLVLQRGKLDILTPGWPKIGVASATLGIVANTRVPLPPLYASLGRWPRGPACWAAARYFFVDSAAALELQLSGRCGSGFEALELLDAVHDILGRLGLCGPSKLK